MRKCPHPLCHREMVYSPHVSTLMRDVYYCFEPCHPPIRVERKSGFSWCLTGTKVASIFLLTGIPDMTDAPALIEILKEFLD